MLCRGSGKNRHSKPEGVSLPEWYKHVGILNKCPLCQGTGEQRYLILNGIRHAISVHSMTTATGKVLAACNWEGTCTEWMDCTPYMDRGKLTVTDTVAICPKGHALKVGTTLTGKNR